jgi:tetratricopeptide (TPR) repeat protein
LRAQGKTAQASKAFDEAVKTAGAEDASWRADAEQALREVTNPGSYYVPEKTHTLAANEGRWTEALRECVRGCEKTNLPADYVKALQYLVDNHPAFKVPDVRTVSTPALADAHYATGLGSYWSGRYADAEREFSEAISFAGKAGADARYYYYLGLAQLAQGQDRRDAALESFRRGSLLEKLSLPPSGAVSEALERVQGTARRLLNRERPGYASEQRVSAR